MKIKVKFFATFRELFGGNSVELEFDEGTVMQNLLDFLCDSPERWHEMFEKQSVLKTYVKVLKDGRNIQFLDGMNTRLEEGNVISIFPPVGGG